jgi:hypothetical protein
MQSAAGIMKEKGEAPLQTGGIRCLKCKKRGEEIVDIWGN